ncbi:MAG: hypothetical protein ND807_12960 [Vicinamibacterales bacterium]|nr:hypothetical protein [Vicinamibacterales bacterium]
MTKIVLSGALTIALAATPGAGAQTQPNLEELLTRVGARIAEFYKRAQNVVCIETSTVQPIDSSNGLDGFARTVESELRVEAADLDDPGEVSIVRHVRRVNGRVPRENDKKDRNGCTDPNPLSTEPLAFLLPGHRSEYQFKSAGFARDRNRNAILIDFATVDRRSTAELIEDKEGHEDCYDWSGHLASLGRIWVDAESFDVMRVDRSLGGPVDVKVPARIQQRNRLDNWVVIVRDNETIRYQRVAFSEPDEMLLLPESINSVTIVRGGLQSTRRIRTLSGCRRFATQGRVVE